MPQAAVQLQTKLLLGIEQDWAQKVLGCIKMSNIKVHLEWHWCLTIPGFRGHIILFILFLLWSWMNDTHTILLLYLGVGLSKLSSDIQVTFYLKLMSFWHWPSLDSEKSQQQSVLTISRYPAKLPMEMRPGTHLSHLHIYTLEQILSAQIDRVQWQWQRKPKEKLKDNQHRAVTKYSRHVTKMSCGWNS